MNDSPSASTRSPSNADPLLPRYWDRLRRLPDSAGFPQLALSVAMFALALAFGEVPRPNFGFSTPPSMQTPTTQVITTTTTVPTTTTTVEVFTEDDLAAVLVELGFPDLELEADGSVVIVTGIVPDDASRRAVLGRLGRMTDVSEVVDRMEIEAAPTAASANVDLSQSAVVWSGTVADDATQARLAELLTFAYRPEQISTEGLTIDPAAASLTTVTVTGSIGDIDLVTSLTETLESISWVRVDVEIDVGDIPRLESELAELLSEDQIFFEPGESEVAESSTATLDAVAAVLAQFPAAVVEVGGHTDTDGNDSANLDLSQLRAEAVVAALRDRGVEAELVAVGYGELRPAVSPERTASDREANRRIEFRLLTS